MKKKLITSIGLFIIFSIFTTCSMAEVIDMPTGWSKDAVTQAIDNNILDITDNLVRPQDMLTRAEMAYGIVNAFGAIQRADMSMFSDVHTDTLYYDEISRAVAMGAISGYGNGLLKPEDTISREEMFAVLYNVLELENGDLKYLDKFNDKELVSDWSKYIVARMVQNGYVSGNAKGNIKAKEDITREEFAQVMKNIFAKYYCNIGNYEEVPAGTVVISKADVTLSNSIVTGDLIISEGVGQGRVTLDNMTVQGRTIIRGGMNAINVLNGSNLGKLIINNKNGKVVISNENSTVNEVEAKTESMLKGTYSKLSLNTPNSVKIVGQVEEIVINESSTVEVADGKVENIIINKNAISSKILGVGIVNKVLVYANNTSILNNSTEVSVAPGVIGVTAAGKIIYLGNENNNNENDNNESKNEKQEPVTEPEEQPGVKTLTLSYNLAGGYGNISPSKYGLKENEISYEFDITNIIPTKTGYKFLGWSEEKNSTVPSYVSGNKIAISRNKTLYAVWGM